MMRRARIIPALAVAVAAGVVGVGTLLVFLIGSRSFYTGAGIHVPASEAQPRTILWQPPTRVSEHADPGADEYEPRLSADGQAYFFVRGRAGSNAEIMVRVRDGARWSDPKPLTAINTESDELSPELSADGSLLLFSSNRKGGLGGYDLWVSRREGSGWDSWGAPTNLGEPVNTAFDEYTPALTPDGTELYFASNRPRPGEAVPAADAIWPATVRENRHGHDYDLYLATRTTDGFKSAEALAALNTDSNEGTPAVSPVGDFLYFSSDRPGGAGGFDLYRARRTASGLGPPESLGLTINTPANELDPALGMGGFAIEFSSDRPSEPGGRPDTYGLFHSESREVYREREARAWSVAGLWASVWPWLLWLLLVAMLVGAFWLLQQVVRNRKLSILARCLIGSAIAHMILLFLLSLWGVTSTLGELLKKPGGGGGGGNRVRLTLAAPSGGGDSLTQQVRGDIVTASVEPVAAPSLTVAPPAPAPVQPRAPEPGRSTLADSRSIDRVELQAGNPRTAPAALSMSPPPSLVVTLNTPTAPPTEATAEPAPASAPRAPSNEMQVRTPAARMTTTESAAPAASVEAPSAAVRPLALATPSPVSPLLPRQPPVPDAAAPSASLATPRDAAPSAGGSEPTPSVSTSTTPSGTPSLRGTGLAGAGISVAPAPTPSSVPSVGLVPVPGLSVSSVAPSAPKATGIPDAAPLSITLKTPLETGAAAAGQPGSGEPQLAAPSTAPGPAGGSPAGSPSLRLSDAGGHRGVPSAPGVAAPVIGRSGLSLKVADNPPATVRPPLPLPGPEMAGSSGLGLRIPTETTPPSSPYAQRAPEVREKVLEQRGGDPDTERAVQRALTWLASHQSADGRWSSDHFDNSCRECGGDSTVHVDAATTGLAVLCFLGAGHTHTKEGPYRAEVTRALDWLLEQQDAKGDCRHGESMYTHAIVTIALAEASGMTKDPRFADPLARAVRFIERARSEQGGWRYEPGQAGDTSVLGWQVMAMISARRAGIAVAPEALGAATAWLDSMSPGIPGVYAYQSGQPPTASMTAEGLFCRQLLGDARDSSRTAESLAFLAKSPPKWGRRSTTYYWYYATLALFQHGGAEWDTWNSALKKELLDHQRTTGKAAGSWDPLDRWSTVGGRVYQTAICTLSLEVYYRYLPMYEQAAPRTTQSPSTGSSGPMNSGSPETR